MTKLLLIQPDTTPNKIGVEHWTQHGKLAAVTGCCGSFVHFNHDTESSWFCAECKDTVMSYDEKKLGASSSQIHLAGMAEETIEEWVSYWTGYPVSRVSVSIRS